MRGDGDGWAFSDTGVRFWGRHGAAGLLVRAPRPDGTRT
ncbi:MAG: NUDIX hydrolase, partial [Mycolicibacter algericus]